MLLNGNDPELLVYDGHWKYFVKGKKVYAARVRFHMSYYYLRKSLRTATQAQEYGRAVVERYKRIIKR